MNEGFNLKGWVQAHKLRMSVHNDRIGEWVLIHDDHNLVVDTGHQTAIDRLFNLGGFGQLSHIGVGSSNTAATAAQTALVTPLGARKPFDATPTRSNKSVSATTTFIAGEATGTIWEFGLFNALTAGTMFSRAVGTAGIPKGANDVIAVTWTITAG